MGVNNNGEFSGVCERTLELNVSEVDSIPSTSQHDTAVLEATRISAYKHQELLTVQFSM